MFCFGFFLLKADLCGLCSFGAAGFFRRFFSVYLVTSGNLCQAGGGGGEQIKRFEGFMCLGTDYMLQGWIVLSKVGRHLDVSQADERGLVANDFCNQSISLTYIKWNQTSAVSQVLTLSCWGCEGRHLGLMSFHLNCLAALVLSRYRPGLWAILQHSSERSYRNISTYFLLSCQSQTRRLHSCDADDTARASCGAESINNRGKRSQSHISAVRSPRRIKPEEQSVIE